MTIVSNEMMRLTLDDGYANVVVTFDATVDPVTGEYDFVGTLISVVVNNTSLTKTVFATVKRPNRVAVINRSFTPGQTQTYTGGGPVKTVEDIPQFALYT